MGAKRLSSESLWLRIQRRPRGQSHAVIATLPFSQVKRAPDSLYMSIRHKLVYFYSGATERASSAAEETSAGETNSHQHADVTV